MFSMEAFQAEFGPKLATSSRWPAFLKIAERLSKIEAPHILETGPLRTLDNWIGDGQSTRIWNWMLQPPNEPYRGLVMSIDLDPQATEMVWQHCDRVVAINGDSLVEIAKRTEILPKLNLLFLDSMDYFPPYELSELHHIGELAIAYPHLPSGCMIAVDDCHSKTRGKHALVRDFFLRAGIPPIYEGYITIWIKP